MPKMKTHSGAKKRFKITANGKVRARHAMRSHILGKKTSKRKRRLRAEHVLTGFNAKLIGEALAPGM